MASLTGWLHLVIMLLLAGNIVALFIGVSLIVWPGSAPGWFGSKHKPRSLRQVLKPLETVHETDKLMMRRPAVLGALLFLAAAIILVEGTRLVSTLTVAQGGEMLMKLFGGVAARRPLWETLWMSVVVFVALGALFSLAIGAAALFRPSLLRQWMVMANRWVSTRKAAKTISGKSYYHVDRTLQSNPRALGIVVTLTSTYVVLMLIWLLRAY